jgi:hypothetical protein
MRTSAGVVLVVLALPSFAQTTWYVDVHATPPGNGTQQSPYVSIQRAITNAATRSGDRILVAPGTYLETVDFLGKTLVVRGAGSASTVIDGSGGFASVIFVGGGEGPGTRIEGFTITGANPGPFPGPHYGGGLRVESSTLEVRECAFEDLGAASYPSRGGGAAVIGGTLDLVRCRFTRTSAVDSGGAVWASGAILLRADHCSFSYGSSTYGEGGAIAAESSSIEVVRSTFQYDVAFESQGGALYLEGCSGRIADSELLRNRSLESHHGGALACDGGALTVERCRFEGNVAAMGGAIRASGGTLDVSSCRFEDNEVGSSQTTVGGSAIHATAATVNVDRSVFRRNRTFPVPWSNEQGAVFGCILERCTIVDNETFGAFPGSAAAGSTLRNCIVRDNLPTSGTISSSTVTYSDVDTPTPGIGNIGADPLFVDQAAGDLRLRAGSPCIDAGDPSSRPDPDGSRADMGAFPFHPVYGLPPSTACEGKVNSQGCEPYMGHNGAPPSLSGGLFEVLGRNEREDTYGILIWSLDPISVPFQGGTLCLGSPVQRTPKTETEEVVPGVPCPAEFEFAWTSAYLASQGLTAGTDVYCQFWGRDAADPWRTTLTDMLAFRLVP